MEKARSGVVFSLTVALTLGILFGYLLSGDSDRQATAGEFLTNAFLIFSFYAGGTLLGYWHELHSPQLSIITLVGASIIGSFLTVVWFFGPAYLRDRDPELIVALLILFLILVSVTFILMSVPRLLFNYRKAQPDGLKIFS